MNKKNVDVSLLLSTIFPKVILDYFEFVKCTESDDCIDYWLDEFNTLPDDEFCKGVRPYGFEEPRRIQDFPIRGKSVYLHIRRRKWYDGSTGKIFSYNFDGLSFEGTRLTPEFVAFLKGAD